MFKVKVTAMIDSLCVGYFAPKVTNLVIPRISCVWDQRGCLSDRKRVELKNDCAVCRMERMCTVRRSKRVSVRQKAGGAEE